MGRLRSERRRDGGRRAKRSRTERCVACTAGAIRPRNDGLYAPRKSYACSLRVHTRSPHCSGESGVVAARAMDAGAGVRDADAR